MGVLKQKLSSRQRGYSTRWDKARLIFLADHPLCVMCENEGRLEPATVVDHVVAHRGDETLFWDMSNWQSLCKMHHDRDKRNIEMGFRPVVPIGVDGWPL